ncbi:MAG: hypothetical protein C0465_01805 [Ralstonia sp.]|nr:hypothetical protein [Ralstonia sp.]POH85719.1 hypothetical protein CJ026_001540 [Ralstonia pickettii]MBA4200275.1 hypothetical protein [Ralstonia sp.]MBA4229365.1 hypothetical protein [Ralstonia sp.]MBA4238220.1 hypothetical protein [Ralstonia sp.]
MACQGFGPAAPHRGDCRLNGEIYRDRALKAFSIGTAAFILDRRFKYRRGNKLIPEMDKQTITRQAAQ